MSGSHVDALNSVDSLECDSQNGISQTDITDDTVQLIELSDSSREDTNNPCQNDDKSSSEDVTSKQSEQCMSVSQTVMKHGKKKKEKKDPPEEHSSDEHIVCQSDGSSTTSSITCRICQLSEAESGERVGTADCHCKGYLDAIHRSCLLEWVRYKGTRVCEVCSSEFSSVPSVPRPSPTDENRQQELEQLFRQYSRLRPVTSKKRTFVASTLVFLLTITAVSAVLTVNTDKHFRDISSNPWSSIESINQAYIVFSICLSFLLFCSALTFGTLLSWITLEVTYHYQRQRVWRRAVQIAAANQTAV